MQNRRWIRRDIRIYVYLGTWNHKLLMLPSKHVRSGRIKRLLNLLLCMCMCMCMCTCKENACLLTVDEVLDVSGKFVDGVLIDARRLLRVSVSPAVRGHAPNRRKDKILLRVLKHSPHHQPHQATCPFLSSLLRREMGTRPILLRYGWRLIVVN